MEIMIDKKQLFCKTLLIYCNTLKKKTFIEYRQIGTMYLNCFYSVTLEK